MAGFDPSLEDIGMDLNAGVDVSSGAAEAGSGGGPMANRFGGRPTVERTTDYDNPISQRFAGVQADPMDDWASEDDLGFDLDKYERELDADVESELNAQAMKEATAGLNKGHWGSGYLPDIIENFKTLVDREFERSKQKTVDHLTNQGMTKKEAQKAVADDGTILDKIDNVIQSINPFKTDWAQENLYGTQSPVVDPLQSKQDFMASNKAFLDKSGLSDAEKKSALDKLLGATAATKKETLSIQKQSKALEKDIEDLKQKIAAFKLGDQIFDDDPTPTSQYDAMSQLGLTGHRFAAGNPVGYGSQAFMDAYTTQQGVEDQLGDGGIAAVDSFTNMPVTPDYYNPDAVPDPKYGYFEYDNAMNQAAKQAVLGGGVPWNSDYAGPISALSGMTGPAPAGFQTSGMTERRELANRLMAEYEGGTGINEQAAQALQKEITLEEISNALAGQPIGSSPLAPAYNEAFNYKGADFPGNAGINAVGTQFGPQWGKTPDPLWAGETPPGPLPASYKANMGEALKAWDSPLQSAYRPEGQLPDIMLQSPQDLVLEQLKQAPPAWMNQGYPDDLPEYDVPVLEDDGQLAGMQEGVYGPPDSTVGLSPVVVDQIESNPAVKEAYVNARQAIIDQLLAKEKFTNEDWYPGSQAAAVKAGFWGPMATKANPAYRAYKDKQRAIMGLKPGEKFMSDNWINAFGGLTPEQINALVGY